MDFKIKAKSLKISKDLIFSYYVDNHQNTELSETRGVVSKMSHRSYREFCFLMNNISYSPPVMITLTFPAYCPSTPKIKKLLLNSFLSYLRSKGVKNYIWIMEFQERGALHFHITCDFPIVSRETLIKKWATSCFQAVWDFPKEFVWIDKDKNVFYDVLKFKNFFYNEFEKHIQYGLDFQYKEVDFRHYLMTHALKLKQKLLPSYCSGGMGRWFGWSRGLSNFLNIPKEDFDIDFYFLRELLTFDFCFKYLHSRHLLYNQIIDFLTLQLEKDFLIMLTTVKILEVRNKTSKVTNAPYIELLVKVVDDSPLKDVEFTSFGQPSDLVGQQIKLDVSFQTRRVKDWGEK